MSPSAYDSINNGLWPTTGGPPVTPAQKYSQAIALVLRPTSLSTSTDRDAHLAALMERQRAQRETRVQFARDLAHEYLPWLPAEVTDTVFEIAWAESHIGPRTVQDQYMRVARVAEMAHNLGDKH